MASRTFFYPDITGPEADRLLIELGQDGSFLTRSSRTDRGCYVLSVRNNNKVEHCKIQNTGDCYDLFGGEKFSSLIDLVQYCVEHPNCLKTRSGEVCRLKKPLYSGQIINERYFHGDLTGKDAELLLNKSHVQDGTYLVKWSSHDLGNIVISVKEGVKVKHMKVIWKSGKFRGPDNHWFDTLSDLINQFKDRLKQPLSATRFIVSDIRERIEELSKETVREQTNKTGFQEEFEMLQCLESEQTYSREEGSKEYNKPKNRYKNILPFDYTRVILKRDPSVEGSDYINANYIAWKKPNEDSSGTSRRLYIAMQGCLEKTVSDLWRMIWESNSHVIVMTTKQVERGKKKCAKYWPASDSPKEFNYFSGKLIVELLQSTQTQHYILRTISIQLKNQQGRIEERRTIFHYHFTTWPDHGVPDDPVPVLAFLQDIDCKQNTINDAGPVVVHCSAGIGRTGTFIIIDMILNEIEDYGLQTEIDIKTMIQNIRKQRSGMVQTDAQYKFIYLAVASFMDMKLKRVQEKQKVTEHYLNTESVSKAAHGLQSSSKPTIKPRPRNLNANKEVVYENLEMAIQASDKQLPGKA